MRIAFFTETFLPATDGVVTRLKHTIEELQRAGDEMLVIAPKYGEGPGSYLGVPIHRVPSVPFPPYPQIKLAPVNRAVGRALRKFSPDLIHAVNPFILGPGGLFYAKRLNVPLVASYHTNIATYADYYNLGFARRGTAWYTRNLHNRADLNLCTSQATFRYLASERVERLRLWPQGVDAERFHPDKFSKHWRVRLTGGHPEDHLLLYVGRLAKEKGIERLKDVLAEMPGVRLALVGDGPGRRDLEKVFAGTPTVFTGTRKGQELSAVYASADALVFPSTTETLGLAMLESLASGLPVLAARTGAAGEVVSDGENGVLYEPRSKVSLIEAVRHVLFDEELRLCLSRNARAAAEGRDWERSTQALRGYYLEALAAR
ncbi:MAG TPA: glycosyltransferase family 1 protein [Rubrobacteraceae bacterium]|nr:glycosyltransferase family 1 protein [Rubrobacteraceae bacterium]